MTHTTSWARWRRGLAAVGLVLPVLAACTPPPSGAATPAGGPASPATAAGQPAPAGTSATPESPPDAALRLEALFGKDALLTADLMRGRLRNDEDFAQAADAAVGANTGELAPLVPALAGTPPTGRIRGLWTDRVTALYNYARGLATEDVAVRDEARSKLGALDGDLASELATASQGRLDQGAARAALDAYAGDLTQQADAYAARDYAAANTHYRDGYQHSFALGHTLAATLLPPAQAGELNATQWRLRSELTRLLGEHVGLALNTLRAGATKSPDFPAALTALNGNTTDVTAAVASLFGDPAGSQFMALWADHLDLLGTYATEAGAMKKDRRAQVQGELHAWQQRFAQFIATATGNRVAAPDLAAALLDLDDLLLRQVDAFAAKDYQQARELADQTYPQVFALARNMADAFGATVAARMPRGGAETGAGGMATAVPPPVRLAPPGPAPAAVGAPAPVAVAGPDPAPAVEPFRSVRSFQEVAAPVRLRIAVAGIDTGLQRLGRAADDTVEVPTDYGVAGWYGDGPAPGEPGPAVILGHVDSVRGPAVFSRLAALTPGTEVDVDRADGSTVAFRVTGVETVAKSGFPTEQVYGPTLQSSLRLVTCGGTFDRSARSYRDNVIVFADPLE